jgi:hypothetical protein
MKLPLMFLFILSISLASAWPLQLLTNGSIIDLGTNETINGTNVDFVYTNDTLFLVPKINVTQNITYLNSTNITYLNSTGNYTIQNITYENNTCVNCTYNQTGIFYNKSEIDTKLSGIFQRGELANYVPRAELTNYIQRGDVNNITGLNDKANKSDITLLWIVLIIVGLIAIGAIVIPFTRE